jgi:hypothetical protein
MMAFNAGKRSCPFRVIVFNSVVFVIEQNLTIFVRLAIL